jgi:DNA-binding transcriptional MerR regulator
MLTIGQLGKRFGISRSTLLYYDNIGVLQPSGRSNANYRLYTEQDVQRLQRIARFRDAGLPLKIIAGLVTDDEGAPTPAAGLQEALEQRLGEINGEIQALRGQQQAIVRLMQDDSILQKTRLMNKTQWTELLRATGLKEKDMRRWHEEFEKLSPEAHQDFMEALGVPETEIQIIREACRHRLKPPPINE